MSTDIITDQIGWGCYVQHPETKEIMFAGMTDGECWDFIKSQVWYKEGETYTFGRMLLNTIREEEEPPVDIFPAER